MPTTEPAPTALFNEPAVAELLKLLQEATRATPQGGLGTYVPPAGGEIAEANYHHFIFGQRGSGKSSLLRHLQKREVAAGRAAVWIDQEIFSNLAYPDVLVSAVHELMKGVLQALEQRASDAPSQGFWRRFFGGSRSMTEVQHLRTQLKDMVTQLDKLKFAPLDRTVEWVVAGEDSNQAKGTISAKMRILTVGAEGSRSHKGSATTKETVEGSKEQYLERALPIFRSALQRAAKELGGGFVFVDDLYQLARASQPLVLAYLHRLVKDSGLWLKIGSIRYSTATFKPGDPPRGMQLGHDAQEVALDRGLRYFQSTQEFLEAILKALASRVGVDVTALLTEEARKRLVLAAGGVARDYLRLTSLAVTEARNRGVTAKPGSHRVIVEDVNKAAGLIAPSKLADMKADDPGAAEQLEGLVRRLTEFCRTRKKAYFLTATNDTALSEQINALQHLRFTHALFQSETVPDRQSQRFDGWLLDVAELSAQRATTGMDFFGWEKREKRRDRRLIFTDSPLDQGEISLDVSVAPTSGE